MMDDEADILESAGLVYVSDTEPGIRRLRRGKGFSYRQPDGRALTDEETRRRIRSLGLPPAYEDVWICIRPDGHLQATGYDARGRKQYRYHAAWQALRSGDKFGQLTGFARALPRIRRRIDRDLASGAEHADGVLAALVALLDAAHLRVGNRVYTRENGTYGATTLLKRHIRFGKDGIRLCFVAKGGKKVQRSLRNPRLQRILEEIADLPGRSLFGWRDEEGHCHSIDSGQLNAYLAGIAGAGVTAKTFRTWGGTLAAFNEAARLMKAGTKPSVKSLCAAAAEALHNTPAVCRSSYIHPAVLDLALASAPADAQALAAPPARRLRGLRADENRLLAYLSAHEKDASKG